MKSDLYKEIIKDKIEKSEVSSNYINTVGRQLTVFSSFESKTLYIESKTQRIMEDYSIHDSVLWKDNKTGNVLYNKKGEISFSSVNVKNNMSDFLYDIPYFLSAHFHKITKEQNLIKFELNDWLRFFTKRFFSEDIITETDLNIELVIDTPFSKELRENKEYKTIDKDNIKFYKGAENRAFIGKSSTHSYFYMSFGNRHHLFKIL